MQSRIPKWPRERFLFFHPPARCRMITTGTYLLSPKDRTNPGGTCWERKLLSKGCLLTLVVEAKLTFAYPEKLVRREHTKSRKTLLLPLPLPTWAITKNWVWNLLRNLLPFHMKGNPFLAHRSGILLSQRTSANIFRGISIDFYRNVSRSMIYASKF